METETKKKRSLFKRWWFWVGVIVIVFIVSLGSNSGQEGYKDGRNGSTPKNEAASTKPEAPTNKPTMTKKEFEAIQNGMSYEEVVKIVGGEGDLISETGAKGDPYYTAIYEWDGEGEIGANANVTFQGGKVESKAQSGLE